MTKPVPINPFAAEQENRLKKVESILDLIGDTPLLQIHKITHGLPSGVRVFAKLEGFNPGGSVKDRPALKMVQQGIQSGQLVPGKTIVDSSSGNTGIALALIGRVLGYPVELVVPSNVSAERKRTIAALGARVIFSDPMEGSDGAIRLCQKVIEKAPDKYFKPNQYFNPMNSQAHYETTGPEIWRQTGGKVDGFVCSVGTGGTLAGVSTYLREVNPDVVIGCADPRGAAMFNLFSKGEAIPTEGDSVTEGIGLGRLTDMIEDITVERPYLIGDEEAIPLLFELVEHEGLCLGGSSGINLAGAVRLARDLGPGHTIVTVLADPGMRYQSKLFNPDFLRAKGLAVPDWLTRRRPAFEVPFDDSRAAAS
jgi:cysteine synthase A